ncbi:MAG: CoA ester lyase [Alphaproteobacteria bacterium]|nr:CoA ester lyase [Alphaproteobacteria bacterium]
MTAPAQATQDRPVWRSLLYVPANVRKYVDKAHTRGADAIQLDLEDSVPVAEKDNARKMVQEAAKIVSQAGADVVVRINQPLRMAIRDLEEVVSPRIRAVVLPKTDSASHIRLLAEVVDGLEAERKMTPGHTLFIALVETADSFFRLNEIAKAHPRMMGIGLGGEDFATSMGAAPDPDIMLYPKQQTIIAARAAGIAPLGIIGTVADYSDKDAMRKMIQNSRRFGFDGASCIHPSIVPILNEGFRATGEEVAAAQRVIQGFQSALAEGRASIEVDGKMIDYPIVERAEKLLARETAIRRREASIAAR